MRLVKLALRNVRRNSRRTAITVVTAVIGVVVIVFARGLVKGFQNETIVSMVETRTGDIQIHRSGYRETLDVLPLDMSFALDEVREDLSGIDGIGAVSGRILFSGQLTTEEESATMVGKAIDVEKEAVICPRLKDSVYLGEFLAVGDRNAIVLTRDLYEALDVELGDTFTLFAASREGAINATELMLKGVTNSDLPDSRRRLGYIPLETAQRLLLMDGIVTEVVVKTEGGRDVDRVRGAVRSRLGGRGLEVNTWKEIEQNLRRMLANHDLLAMVVSAILFVIVFSTVTNTMLMVVLERTGEIGTMTALGLRSRYIMSLFLLEGGLKGVIGGVIGTAVGAAGILALKSAGIPFRMPGGSGAVYMIRPEIDLETVVLAFLFSVGAALLASVYPALRAARTQPVEALRSV
jgi:putative ABC transport system permease protein